MPASLPPFPVNAQSQSLTGGQVANPTLYQVGDGNGVTLNLGRNNDLLTSQVHGRYYNASARGNVFVAAPAGATGLTILAFAGTTSGFMVYNPAGSNVNMEILEVLVSPLTATNAVAGIGLEYGAPPTAVSTAITPRLVNVGGRALGPVCKASNGSTIAAMTFLQWLPMQMMTTTTLVAGGAQLLYKPEGSLVIAPGGAINIAATASESTNLWMQHVVWAEWPF